MAKPSQSDTKSPTLQLCVEGWYSHKIGKLFAFAAYTNAAATLQDAELEEKNFGLRYDPKEPELGDGMSTEQLKVAADLQLGAAESAKQLHQRQFISDNFRRTTPGYVDSFANAGRLEARMRDMLRADNRQWPLWRKDDLERAADSLAAEGALELSGPWRRLTPTNKQLEKMSLDELRQRAFGVWEEED